MRKIIYIATFLLLLLPAVSLAETTKSPLTGFSLSPTVTEAYFNPGESSVKTLYVTNNTGQPTVFKISVEDFASAPDPRQNIQLQGDSASASLKGFLKPETDQLVVDDGKTVPLKVFIKYPDSTSVEGLYGAVIVEQEINEKNPVATKIYPRIGALFYLGLEGMLPQSADITGFRYIPFESTCGTDGTNCDQSTGRNNQFVIDFLNSSKVHIAFSGDIKILNLIGRTVDTVQVKPWIIMPDSQKERSLSWEKKTTLFGVYRAVLNMRDAHSGAEKTKTIYMWFFPWQIVAALLIIALAILLVLRYLKKHFRLVKKILPKKLIVKLKKILQRRTSKKRKR